MSDRVLGAAILAGVFGENGWYSMAAACALVAVLDCWRPA